MFQETLVNFLISFHNFPIVPIGVKSLANEQIEEETMNLKLSLIMDFCALVKPKQDYQQFVDEN